MVLCAVGFLCSDRAEGMNVGAWIQPFSPTCQTGIALADVLSSAPQLAAQCNERCYRMSAETNSSEKIWSTWADLIRGSSGVGIEADRELALSAVLQTCLREMWEEIIPVGVNRVNKMKQGTVRLCPPLLLFL